MGEINFHNIFLFSPVYPKFYHFNTQYVWYMYKLLIFYIVIFVQSLWNPVCVWHFQPSQFVLAISEKLNSHMWLMAIVWGSTAFRLSSFLYILPFLPILPMADNAVYLMASFHCLRSLVGYTLPYTSKTCDNKLCLPLQPHFILFTLNSMHIDLFEVAPQRYHAFSPLAFVYVVTSFGIILPHHFAR